MGVQRFISNDYDVTMVARGRDSNAVTKSGPNDLTGSLFTTTRERPPHTGTSGCLRRKFSLTQFGDSLGGRFVKDRRHPSWRSNRQLGDALLRHGSLGPRVGEIRSADHPENLQRMERSSSRSYGTPTRAQHFGEFNRAPASTHLSVGWTGRWGPHRLTRSGTSTTSQRLMRGRPGLWGRTGPPFSRVRGDWRD